MDNNKKTLPFGQRIRVGNFVLLKYTKSIGKKELKALRENLPKVLTRELSRSSVPFIRIEAASGIWALEYSCVSAMYSFIDRCTINEKSELLLSRVFSSWFADTSILGDPQYIADKAQAVERMLDRMKKEETPEDKAADDEVLRGLQQDEEAKSTIRDMVNTIRESEEAQKGGEDGR